MPLTLKNFNQTTPPAKTFTISRTEKSDMSSGWTYSDDAAGLTAGSTAFDEFFGYSGVKLATDGTETAEITQTASGGYGKLDITQLPNISSGDSVMIKFPVRGIKMTKSSGVITLSITDALGRESEGFQYYAFQNTGDIEANASTTVATKPLYLGTYLSYETSSGYHRSWSGESPQNEVSLQTALSEATRIGTGWTVMGWYQRCLINAYYMMKYGNPDCKSVIGMGYIGASAKTNTGGTNSQINATYGTSSKTQQVKLFGLEDWWGNLNQLLGGAFTDGSRYLYTALHDFSYSTSTSQSQYKLAGATQPNTNNTCISSIVGTNKGMFGPFTSTNNTSWNTYYCAYTYIYTSNIFIVGGSWSNDQNCSLFRTGTDGPQNSATRSGSRLMYL